MTIEFITYPTMSWYQPEGTDFSEGYHIPSERTVVKFRLSPKGMPVIRSLHDAIVIWTGQIRSAALRELKEQRPDLYARYDLATLGSYRDMQRFCSLVTKQSYCEIRGNNAGSTNAAIFGGTSGVPTNEDNPTPMPHIQGGFVYWYVKGFSRTNGYETICRIAKPENWQGDEAEAQKWVEFVDNNIDKVVDRLKKEDDPAKKYFDIHRIPDLSNSRSLLGYSPLSYK